MIAAGEIRVKQLIKVGEVQRSLGKTSPRYESQERVIQDKEDLKNYNCLKFDDSLDNQCAEKINSLPDNEDALKLGAEIGRFCFREVHQQVQISSTQCVVNTFNNAANLKAGDRMTTGGSKGGLRELFVDTPNSNAIVKTVGQLTLAQVIEAAKSRRDAGGDKTDKKEETEAGDETGSRAAGWAEAEAAEDGTRQQETLRYVQKGKPAAMGGSLTLSGSRTDQDTNGFGGTLKLNGTLSKGRYSQWTWEAEAKREKELGVQTESHIFQGQSSSGAAETANDFHVTVSNEYAVWGSHATQIPAVYILSSNEAAKEFRETINKRWGENAAEIYWTSVVTPWLGRAKNYEEFNKVWNTKGSALFEQAITGTLKVEDYASSLIEAFKYDPAGLVDLIALLKGEKYEKTREAFKDVMTEEKKEEFAKKITDALKDLKPADIKYKLPKDYEDQENPAEVSLPSEEAISEGYMEELKAKEKQIAEALGVTPGELREKAEGDAKVKYPFDEANDPKNVWAAQLMYDDFVKKVVNPMAKGGTQLVLKSTIGGHDYDPLGDYPGLGLTSEAVWKGDSWSLSLKGFVGWARFQPIAEKPEERTWGADGMAYSVGVGATYGDYLSVNVDRTAGDKVAKNWTVSGALTYPMSVGKSKITAQLKGTYGSFDAGTTVQVLNPNLKAEYKVGGGYTIVAGAGYKRKISDKKVESKDVVEGSDTTLNDGADGIVHTPGKDGQEVKVSLGVKKDAWSVELFGKWIDQNYTLVTAVDSGVVDAGAMKLFGGALTLKF